MKGGLQHHESRPSATLAAAVLKDGSLERTDAWTPLDELISQEPLRPGDAGYHEDMDQEKVLTLAEIEEIRRDARVATLTALLRYIWFGAKNPWDALKRLLAVTRKIKPEFIRGMSGQEVANLLGETRAATSAREIRVVEGYLRSWGVLGFQGAGGSKSVEARRIYSQVQKGNKNRANGTAKNAAEHAGLS